MLEERAVRLMFLILRNEITRGSLHLERESVTLNERSKWSVNGRLSAVRAVGVRPEQQIKSRI